MGGPTEREKGLSEGGGTRVSRREPPAAEEGRTAGEGARAPRAPRGPSRPSWSSSVDFGLSGSLGSGQPSAPWSVPLFCAPGPLEEL
nr:uncharacterized protein LOC118973343 isoform X2 [Manis javanica]